MAWEFTDAYFAQPAPIPPSSECQARTTARDDPLLSDRSWAVSSYRPDIGALAAAPTRIVIAVGEESLDTLTGRTATVTAEAPGNRRLCSRATTAASSAASLAMRANPRPSRTGCATS